VDSQLLADVEPLGEKLDQAQLDDHIGVRALLHGRQASQPSGQSWGSGLGQLSTGSVASGCEVWASRVGFAHVDEVVDCSFGVDGQLLPRNWRVRLERDRFDRDGIPLLT